MTWLRFAASPPFAGFVAVCAAASIGACHLIGGAGDLTFEAGAGGSGAGSSGTAGGDAGGLPLGAECDPDANACASGICVDDVCCNVACGGDCETCAAPGLEGTCSPDIGASCGDDNICDGAGRCATGTVDWALIGGGVSDEVPGRGAISGTRLRFVGRAVDGPVNFGPLELIGTGNDRSFIGEIDDQPMGSLDGLGESDGTQTIGFVAAFPDGGYVVAGTATGTFNLSPVQNLDAGTVPTPVVIAFQPDGTPLWGKKLPTALGQPQVFALAASETHVAVAFDDDSNNSTRNRLVILSRSGGGVIQDMAWDMSSLVGTGGRLTGLAYDPLGRLWASGWCADSASIATATTQLTVGPTAGRIIPLLVQYNESYDVPSGGVTVIGDGIDVRLSAVSATEESVYVAGTLGEGTLSQDAVEGDPVQLVADAMGEDPFVLVMDRTGRARWGRSFSSMAGAIELPGLAHDDAGNVVIAGSVEVGQVTLGQTTIGSVSNVATFVAKMVPNGEVAWVRGDSGPNEPRLNWVGIDDDGRTWATGMTFGTVFGAEAIGNADMLLLRLAP